MMTTISELTNPIAEYVPDFVKSGFEKTIINGGRLFTLMQQTPQLMNQNHYVAGAVCLLVNGGLFFTIHLLANVLDTSSENKNKKLSDQRAVKTFLINVFVVGGSTLTANVILSTAVQYQMSKVALVGWTAASIALRYYLNNSSNASKEAQ